MSNSRLVIRVVILYTTRMIKSFRHKGLQAFFETGSKTGIQSKHAVRLNVQLTTLNTAISPQDMNATGWKLHKLFGNNPKGQPVQDHWSVSVSGKCPIPFCFASVDTI